MFSKIKYLLFGKSRRAIEQEIIVSDLQHGTRVLEDWLEETKKERDYYKNLLLEKTGVIVPLQVATERGETPQPVGKKSWNTVKHDLEMQSLRKYWDSRKVNKGEIPGGLGK